MISFSGILFFYGYVIIIVINTMSKLLITNWKMDPPDKKTAITLARSIDATARKSKNVSVGIAPSFPHIGILPKLKSVWIGAQDVFWENPVDGGAYTGEVSLNMLKNLGATFVIIGHSERRKNLEETDDVINKKVKMLTRAKFFLVLCVGEPLSVRNRGLTAAKKYVADELRKDLRGVKDFKKYGVVAYEPIWAISTNKNSKPDNPEIAAEMAEHIKKITGADILYGGSVNAKNAEEFLREPSISGALVGSASLNAKEFTKIIGIANGI